MGRRFKFQGASRSAAGIGASLYAAWKSKKGNPGPGKSGRTTYKHKKKPNYKSKKRVGYSSTSTSYSKKTKIVKNPGLGLTNSFHYSGSTGRVDRYIMKLPQTKFKSIQVGANASGFASQGILSASIWGSSNDIQSLFNNAAVDSGTVQASTSLTKKLYIGRFQHNALITNSSLDTAKVWIYDLICREDQPFALGFTNPEAHWALGVVAQEGPNTNSQFFPGDRPTQYKIFNQYWYVSKCTIVELGGGLTHNHVWKGKINKVYDYSKIKTQYATRGLTRVIMVVHHGMPHDSKTDETTGSVSLSELKLVWAITNESSGTLVSTQGAQEYQINNLTANPTHVYGVVKSEETIDFAVAMPSGAAVAKNILQGLGV